MLEKYIEILKSEPEKSKSPTYCGDAAQRSIIEVARRGSQTAMDAILEFEREWRLNYYTDPFWDQFNKVERIHPTSACLMAFDKDSHFSDLKQFLIYLQMYCWRDGVPADFRQESFIHEEGIATLLENLHMICLDDSFGLDPPNFNFTRDTTPTNTYLILNSFFTVTNDFGLYCFLSYIKEWSPDVLEPSAIKELFPKVPQEKFKEFIPFSGQNEFTEEESIEGRALLNETLKRWWALAESVSNLRVHGPHKDEKMSVVACHVYGRLLAVSGYVNDALKAHRKTSLSSSVHFGGYQAGFADLGEKIAVAVEHTYAHIMTMAENSKHQNVIKRYEIFHRETILETGHHSYENFLQFFDPVEN